MLVAEVAGLGCFIKLRYPNGARSIFGLTNFHVVMPYHEEYKRHNHSTLTRIQKEATERLSQSICLVKWLGHARTSHVQVVKDIEGDVVDGIPANRQYRAYLALKAQGKSRGFHVKERHEVRQGPDGCDYDFSSTNQCNRLDEEHEIGVGKDAA